ncbi:DUF2194 domain-containing protein [Gramella lutea]|uniref:DUF2194 domain-containing protein n=1 Tax=Christiangramia lutea TaxID=1607951 RepID=A0A9X2A8T8_9FLAO|nr:DUF2194 domain-containing protein [Christiangramia lutea]MCH4822909.1 DUF2194 domain-containing protein [Christiangramia lutea]
MLIFLSGCADDEYGVLKVDREMMRVAKIDNSKPLVTYIIDPEDPYGQLNLEQLKQTLNYVKIPFSKIELDEFNSNSELQKSIKVVVIEDLSGLKKKSYNSLLQFVANGGQVVISKAGVDENFGFMAGVKQGANYETDTLAMGYRFKTNFLPAMNSKVYRNRSNHFGLKGSNFSEKVEVLASSINQEDYPVILKNRIGRGNVLVFNTTQVFPKEERGLLFAALLPGLEGVPYPVANVSSIFLDDFPAPLYDIKREPVTTEMDISQANYYMNVWWEDMLELAREENLEYSAYVCFDYSNQTTPPFNFYEWQNSGNAEQDLSERRLNRLMRNFNDLGHEMALHGYNHASLTREIWPSQKYMELSLEAVNKRWLAEEYGSFPRSYVPPSNIIDSLGFAALESSMPSIVYNASIYLGDFEEGGGREFGPEPLNDHFFNFPRITSGFELESASNFTLHSAYLYTGIWTHFVHPDDVFQIPGTFSSGDYQLRNSEGYGWRVSEDGSPGLFPRFRQYLNEIKKLYPFIRFLKVSDAARITMNWRYANYRFSENEERLKMESNAEGLNSQKNFWFTYVKKENSLRIENYLKNNNFQFTRTTLLDGFLYNIESPSAELELPRLRNIGSKARNDISAKFEDYLQPEEEVQEQNIREQIGVLKSEIERSRSFKKQTWLQLLRYLGWEDRTSEIWPLLDFKYSNNKNYREKYILFSKAIIKETGDYPDLNTRERWMLRQLEVNPANLTLKKKYIDYFGSENGVTFTKEELLQLYANSEQPDEKNSYYSLLIHEFPGEAFRMAKEAGTCTDNELLSANMAWTLADNGYYKEAILLSQCTDSLSQSDVDDWRLQTGEYEFLEGKNYSLYLEYLIEDNPGMAARKLIDVDPCKEKLKPISVNIAYAFAAQGSFRKALEWSACSDGFPIVERLQWLYALQNFQKIEEIYKELSQDVKSTEDIQHFMADYYLGRGEIVKSWKFTSELSPGKLKSTLQKQLNKDVVYLDYKEKKELLDFYPALFYPEVKQEVEKEIRIENGNFLQIDSEIISDRFDPTSFRTSLSYGMKDKNFNTHMLGLSKRNAYAVNAEITAEENSDERLMGLSYRFISNERAAKFNYNLGSELEFNNRGKAFLHLDARISYSKDSLFSSLQLFRRPAITGPAYILDIYQSQINIYEELQFKRKWQAILYVEANHYEDDNVMDVQASTNLTYDLKLGAGSKFKPYTEISGMLGNTNRPSGYPYWTLDERFYGGFGASYEYRNEESAWLINLDAAYFLDTFSDQFQRYRGSVLWPVTPFLHFKANAEFYSLKNFYSNNFGFGLKYYFKD